MLKQFCNSGLKGKSKTNPENQTYNLAQGSQKRGPWAACGPPDVFVLPASS